MDCKPRRPPPARRGPRKRRAGLLVSVGVGQLHLGHPRRPRGVGAGGQLPRRTPANGAAVSAGDADMIGLGMTAMSLRPGATPLELAIKASAAALSDAGLGRADVDGILVGSSQGVRPDRLGVGFAAAAGFSNLRLLEHVEIKGATTIAMIQRARHAIVTGEASTVLCVFADAPLVAGRGAGSTYAHSGGNAGVRGVERASGLLGSVPTYALLAQRWLHVTGTGAYALRSVATTARG